jgi:CBS-domain-containing membrane protein
VFHAARGQRAPRPRRAAGRAAPAGCRGAAARPRLREPGALPLARPRGPAAPAARAQVLEKLVANRLHRLYVVDAELRPVGIVTLTDILRTVTQKSVG